MCLVILAPLRRFIEPNYTPTYMTNVEKKFREIFYEKEFGEIFYETFKIKNI